MSKYCTSILDKEVEIEEMNEKKMKEEKNDEKYIKD